MGGVVSALVCLGLAAGEGASTFTVTIPADMSVAHVEASYELAEPYLRISEGVYSDGVDGGLAGFVENLSVARSDGTAAGIEGPLEGRWRVDVAAGARVQVRYDVRLEHARSRWPFGVDEVAYVSEESVFFVARTLLILPPGLRESRIRFDLPTQWRVATPWTPVEGEEFVFDVGDARTLTENCVVAGRFIEQEFRAGDTVVRLTIGTALESHAESLAAGIRVCVPAFRDIFQDSPQARFLAIVDVNPAGGIIDGSAFANSVSMITSRRLARASLDRAVYTMAHEILHLWNGIRMRAATGGEWLKEGFTDYLTWTVLADEDLVEEKTILFELRRQLSAYENLERTLSIASATKQTSEGYVLVYEGASLLGLCLDREIRKRSGEEREFSDFMRALYAQSALQDKPYDASTIVSVATEIAGSDMQPFFERYVEGMTPLPLDEVLADFGLRVERTPRGTRVSVSAVPVEDASGDVARRRDRFLGRK